MNDKLIINTISKIYFIIISFLLFIFLSFSIIFIVLQNGLYIENLSFANLKIKQLYIKWDKKLNVSVKESQLFLNNKNSKTKIDIKSVNKYINLLPKFTDVFNSIEIKLLKISNFDISVKYSYNEDGYIKVSSNEFVLNSNLAFESELLHINIKELIDKDRDITAKGSIILNTITDDITSIISLNIHNEVFLDLLAYKNENILKYKVISTKDIKSITYTMELLDLHKDVRYWAYEAIGFSSLIIENVNGWIDFTNPDDSYKNITAAAVGKELTYKYNKDLDAIHTKETKVEFKNGVLYINPKEHYTYDTKLQDSWLKIDFTKKEELLTLYLLFDGKLDKHTLNILKAYKIEVPFLQNSGSTKTNLTIKVNLRTIGVDAKGDFFSKKANFRYKGFDIDVFDAYIKLDNYDVSITNMLTKYKNMIDAKIDVKYNAKKSEGAIDLSVNNIDIKEMNFFLNQKGTPLKVKYSILKEKDLLSIEKAKWILKNKELFTENIELPFNLETFMVEIPKATIEVKDMLKAEVSGKLDLDDLEINLNIDLSKIKTEMISTNKPIKNIKLKYNKKLQLTSNSKIDFNIESQKSSIGKISLIKDGDDIELQETTLKIGDYFTTNISAKYFQKENIYNINTTKLSIEDKKLGSIYKKDDKSTFKVFVSDESIKLRSNSLKASFISYDSSWHIDINSISKISKDSKLLQQYHLNKGTLDISKKSNEEHIDIKSTLTYPYKILTNNDNGVSKYKIKATVDTNKNIAKININDKVFVDTNKDSIDVDINNTGINFISINNLIKETKFNDNNNSKIKYTIASTSSYIEVAKNRKIIFDDLICIFKDNNLSANMKHKNGIANLLYKDNTLSLSGEGFGEVFLRNLFYPTKFHKGSLEFKVAGKDEKYNGIMSINQTTIKDYKMMNNILAFVNTIPSLITFSLPGYSTKGLKVDNSYIKFTFENNKLDMSDMYLHSKELDILGSGNINLDTETVNVELNLKTDVGSKISKIPLLGHLLMDGNSVSTTLTITGDYNNPVIFSALAKDIAVAPLNILWRTIKLPYSIFNDDKNVTTKKVVN